MNPIVRQPFGVIQVLAKRQKRRGKKRLIYLLFNKNINVILKSVWTRLLETILTGDNILRGASGGCCGDVGNCTVIVPHILCKVNPLLLVVKFQSLHTLAQLDGGERGAVIGWV